jgi:predicted deacylase
MTPLLGTLEPGTTQRHLVKLPGAALTNDEPRSVITVTGAQSGPILFVNGGLHGAEYPAIEAVIRLGKILAPASINGTVILMPVLNMPAFRSRTPFVCPIDNVNPNRLFPGDPNGTYSEQMVHALVNEFIAHADAYIDLHGGDIPEDLVPFVICAGSGTDGDNRPTGIGLKSKEMAIAFGLPYVLTVSKPVQPAKGSSSYAGAAERGVPAILAEAGAVGRLQEDAVEMLMEGVVRVMRHLGMMATGGEANVERRTSNAERRIAEPKVLRSFEWVYSKHAGMWYSRVAAGDLIEKGQEVGSVGDLFGDTLETIFSPVTGTVLFLTVNPSVQANGLLMGIGA